MQTDPMSGNDNLNKEIIQWGYKCLCSLGYTLKSNLPENVQNRPWSHVVHFETSDGYIYLKHTPDLLALEASVIQILHDQFHASVPNVIAHNAELNCFLMKDAGRPLREVLKQRFDVSLLCKAVDQFTSIQLAVANHVNVFFDVGVPDWRLDKLPDLYMKLLSQKDLLIEDGLTEIEIIKLETLLPTVSNLCEKLSSHSIQQTLTQCDFHDNNLLIDDRSQNITIIDLGEIVISHPFFSLVGCLQQTKKHHSLTDEDDAYLKIMNAWFENYMDFASKETLLDVLATANTLWFVYEILAQHRLMIACGKERLMSFQHGRLSGSLKEFMAACITTDKP